MPPMGFEPSMKVLQQANIIYTSNGMRFGVLSIPCVPLPYDNAVFYRQLLRQQCLAGISLWPLQEYFSLYVATTAQRDRDNLGMNDGVFRILLHFRRSLNLIRGLCCSFLLFSSSLSTVSCEILRTLCFLWNALVSGCEMTTWCSDELYIYLNINDNN
jgi:hypothetical protein